MLLTRPPILVAVVLEGQQFGVNTASSDIPLGILGLAPWLGGRNPKYSFVLDTMVAQGEINSRTFSLDLRSINSPDGGYLLSQLPNVLLTSSRIRRFRWCRHEEVYWKSGEAGHHPSR
jgi:hypothetical protein